jgi:AcrR family transcriptional regulator
MADAVKPKRRYHSPRRQEQAAATRQAILEAAQRLFEEHGYVATTMDAIAIEARVALKTVYSAFATKSGLLRALWDLLLKGDADDAPVADRPWYREVLQEPDPERQLRLNARNACVVKRRIGPILRVIRSAAAVEPDADALWQLIQSDFYANQRVLVAAVHERGGLRPDLDVDRATDILWSLSHPSLWQLLVRERRWTPEDYEAWCADTSVAQLLRASRATRSRSPSGP